MPAILSRQLVIISVRFTKLNAAPRSWRLYPVRGQAAPSGDQQPAQKFGKNLILPPLTWRRNLQWRLNFESQFSQTS